MLSGKDFELYADVYREPLKRCSKGDVRPCLEQAQAPMGIDKVD